MSYTIYIKNQERVKSPINKKNVENWVDELINWLFDINQEYNNYRFFQNKEKLIHIQLQDILAKTVDDTNEIIVCSNYFFEQIEHLYYVLNNDLETIVNFDPAAKSKEEVLISYPGFFAITAHRIANIFWKLNIPTIPRIISEYVHSQTGIDIHPGAEIGENFFIDHGTGIVIGETTKIGNNVKIYQGVTLGALSVSKDNASVKRHPTLEDNVTIYANATILGGNTVIGANSVIGGNVWITHTIPQNSLVYHKSEIEIKKKSDFPEPLNYVI
ncbi:serine O-acetyltransferase EpsC [Flavobacterium sp. SUN052]|uniref:serine O-acetyltransferase EpsC n=1 Tax=Flavobacterium sp. SUN052 TaxID=3002441 RepID=UPI00237E64EC|nr:serine O-acetyltransferase EpsC [Flavobacterium sp. SUN052]MEC4004562.1 serine O-acetyltransferase EpsC [Flavobacterium sp. SUN052]